MACYQGVVMDLRTIKEIKIGNSKIKEIRSADQKIWSGENWIWDFDFTKSNHEWAGSTWVENKGFLTRRNVVLKLAKKYKFKKDKTYYMEMKVKREQENININRIKGEVRLNVSVPLYFDLIIHSPYGMITNNVLYFLNENGGVGEQRISFDLVNGTVYLQSLKLKEV